MSLLRVAALVALAAAVGTRVTHAQSAPASPALANATALVDQGRFAEAEKAIEAIVAADPRNALASSPYFASYAFLYATSTAFCGCFSGSASATTMRLAGNTTPSAAAPAAFTYWMLAKPWLWKIGTVTPSWRAFLITIACAGSIDQLRIAWTFAAFTFVTSAVRSVAALS